MATEPLQDNVILSGLFDKAFSPITNYGQSLLAIAMQKREREDKRVDETRRESFQLNRDRLQDESQAAHDARVAQAQMDREKMIEANQTVRDAKQEAHSEKMIGLNADARVKERKAEFEQLSAAKKEEKRTEAIDQARAEGVTLPDNAPYSQALEAVYKSQGRRLIAAGDSVSSAMDQFADAREQTKQEILVQATGQAVAGLSPKDLKASGLSQADQNKLMTDPSALTEFKIRALRSKDKEASVILNKIGVSANETLATGMADAEKSKPYLAGLSDRFKVASDNFKTLVGKGGYDEASSIEASKKLIGAVRQGPPVPPPQLFPLAPRQGGAPAIAPPVAPPAQAAGGYPGMLPFLANQGMAVGDNLYKGGKILAAPVASLFRNANAALWGTPFENPVTAMTDQWHNTFYPPPAAPAPAPDNTAASIAEFMRTNPQSNSMFPTAFPAP